jgi:hypothetical protein
MKIEKDSSKQSYIEIPMDSRHTRVTLIPNGWTGTEAIRISIREESGHLRPGPEIPIAQVGDLVKVTIELLRQTESK